MNYPEIGFNLGKFELLSVIGEGTTSRVYRSYNKYFKKEVVIKVLSPNLVLKNPKLKEIFFEEAYILSKISHPNIIKILDADENGIYSYSVTEFLEGNTIEDILKEKIFFGPREAIKIIIQICEALDYLKTLGIVHRDIKPGNIILSRCGIAKIIDFGISKVINEPVKYALIGGPMCGTLYYMSPEQLTDSERVDHRADMYSLGATFYHMVTGRKPFESNSVSEIMTMHITETPKEPKTLSLLIIDELSNLIMTLLEKTPSKRFEDYKSLINCLESIYKKYEKMESDLKYEKIFNTEMNKAKNDIESYINSDNEDNQLQMKFFEKLNKDTLVIKKTVVNLEEEHIELAHKFLKNLTKSNVNNMSGESGVIDTSNTGEKGEHDLAQIFLKNITNIDIDNDLLLMSKTKIKLINDYPE